MDVPVNGSAFLHGKALDSRYQSGGGFYRAVKFESLRF